MRKLVWIGVLLLVSVLVFAAIDSRNKRGAASSVGTAWVDILPSPDGVVGAADRMMVAGEYQGITPDDPPEPGEPVPGYELALCLKLAMQCDF